MDKSNGEIRSIAKWFRLYQMGRKSGWYIPEGVFYMSFEGYIYEICWNSFVDVKGRKRASRKEEFLKVLIGKRIQMYILKNVVLDLQL